MQIKNFLLISVAALCIVSSTFAEDITDEIDSSNLDKDIIEPNVIDEYTTELDDYASFPDPESTKTYTSKDKVSYEFKLHGIRVINAKFLTEVEVLNAYKKFKNKMVTFADLKEISNNLNAIYKEKGYLLSFVVIPEQRINQSGIVSFVAIEGFIDNIFIVDKTPEQYSKILVKYAETNLKGVPLKKDDFFKFFMLVEDLPGITVYPNMLPSSDKFGASSLVLAIKEKSLFGSIFYDNQASKRLGPEQQRVEFGVNSISYGSQLKFNYARSTITHAKKFALKDANFKQKIGGSGTTLSMRIIAQETEPYFEDPRLRELKYQGKSKYFILGISHPLILTYQNRLDLSMQASFIKNTNFTKGSILQQDRIRSMLLKANYRYNSSILNKLGTTYLTIGYNQGFKGLGNRKNPAIPSTRQGGRQDYTAFDFYAARFQNIHGPYFFLAELTGQYSMDILLQNSRFSFGGNRFGQGYDSSILSGDHGIATRFEILRRDATSIKWINYTEIGIAYDFGKTWHKGYIINPATTRRTESASSIAINFRTKLLDHITASLIIAKPLTHKNLDQNKRRKIFFALQGSF